MAKWKSKIITRMFNDKQSQVDNSTSANQADYYNNIVPPVNSKIDSPYSNFNNVEVDASFVIPLKEEVNSLEKDNPLRSDFSQQPVPAGIDTTALIVLKDNFKIPKPISFEIRAEKLKQLILCFFSLIIMAVSSLFISFYFKGIDLNYVPHAAVSIPIIIISSAVFLINLLDFIALKREVNLYIERTLKGSLLPPNFIIRNYRKIHGRVIMANWLFIFCYITLGVATGVMFLISGQKLTFIVQSWTVQIPNLYQDAITISVLLAVLLSLHMAILVLFKKRKSNIISYYGYEVINPADLEVYKKKINRICMIITISFIAIIFFVIVIPILIIRRRKKRG